MKNLKQIENMLKTSGLTGGAFKDEFHRQALLFGKQLIEEMTCGVDAENFNYQDVVLCMAHISEIFMYAANGSFYHDFAEHFQIEVFNASPEHTDAFCNWRNKLSAVAVRSTDEGKTEQPKQEPADNAETENTALLISRLLNNPNVPPFIRDALDNALCETRNYDTAEINAFWKSPEYIAMVLRGAEASE